jgi:LacI family transcriptional regulator
VTTIAFISSARTARSFGRFRKPLVNVCASLAGSGWPVVANDDLAISQMAAEHFLEHGYRDFAYVGHRGGFAPELQRGFAAHLKAEGLGCRTFAHGAAAFEGRTGLSEPTAAMRRWVAGLPTGTAVLAIGNLVGAADARPPRRRRPPVHAKSCPSTNHCGSRAG